VYFSTDEPTCSGHLNYPTTTRQAQLVAVPNLIPPSAMAGGIPHEATREVQWWLLTGLGQRGGRILWLLQAAASA
jgi:hypothetical protein